MSQFDPQSFLDATITEVSAKRQPLPAGQDFVGTIKDVKPRAWQGKKDPSQSGIAMDVQIEIPQDSGPAVLLTDGIMLDTTEGGAIDLAPGRNGKLRRYREALDMNTAGQAFSFRAMIGRLIKVKIKHEVYEGEVYDRVDGVAKAA